MDPISILYGLGQFVPQLLRWAGKDNAAEVADKAVKAVGVITGKESLDEGVEAIKANPELLVKYQQTMNEVIIHQLDAETRQLEAVNATMRAEYATDDNYTRRWRPTLGYGVTITWVLQMTALSWVIATNPTQAASVIAAMAQLTAIWGVALALLGVSVVKRSEDKQTSAGFEPAGIMGSIGKVFGKPR
ncbi:MAG: hypothetical protein JJE27_06735 [Thermoleophilia bacterium]|nr:hypothetical protein [Thermoleophilia bacterium]